MDLKDGLPAAVCLLLLCALGLPVGMHFEVLLCSGLARHARASCLLAFASCQNPGVPLKACLLVPGGPWGLPEDARVSP